jgi:signal transduction histidine kinase
VGQLPFLPQAPSGLWLVEFLQGRAKTDLIAVSLGAEYLRQWLAHLSKAIASQVYLVTADNLILPQNSPDLFAEAWASKALSRSTEGVFFTIPTPDVLVHVYADPGYLFNLLAVMPRTSLTATVDTVIDQTTILTTGVATVLGLITLGLLALFTHQLRRLTKQLSGITEGNFRTLPEGMGAFLTETDTIARGVNTLATRLEANQHTLGEANRELEKMAALGRTVAAFTHEINNPLGAALTIIGLVEETAAELRKELSGGAAVPSNLGSRLETLSDAASMVDRSLQRAIDVTHSMKTVAADQSRPVVRDYDLGDYLNEMSAALNALLRHPFHTLDLVVEPQIHLRGDPAVFYQILSNLVINSVRHGFEGRSQGRITVEVRKEADEVIFQYRDDGNGMGPEQLARLYEPFYTTKRNSGGTGLGMSIVQRAVRTDLAGQVTCESNLGEGVLFTIRFPVHRTEDSR